MLARQMLTKDHSTKHTFLEKAFVQNELWCFQLPVHRCCDWETSKIDAFGDVSSRTGKFGSCHL